MYSMNIMPHSKTNCYSATGPLTDIGMPEMDGLELLQTLKANPETHSLPVIVLTGSEDMQSQEKALKLGADDFIVKPVTENDLLPRINRLLRKV